MPGTPPMMSVYVAILRLTGVPSRPGLMTAGSYFSEWRIAY